RKPIVPTETKYYRIAASKERRRIEVAEKPVGQRYAPREINLALTALGAAIKAGDIDAKKLYVCYISLSQIIYLGGEDDAALFVQTQRKEVGLDLFDSEIFSEWSTMVAWYIFGNPQLRERPIMSGDLVKGVAHCTMREELMSRRFGRHSGYHVAFKRMM